MHVITTCLKYKSVFQSEVAKELKKKQKNKCSQIYPVTSKEIITNEEKFFIYN